MSSYISLSTYKTHVDLEATKKSPVFTIKATDHIIAQGQALAKKCLKELEWFKKTTQEYIDLIEVITNSENPTFSKLKNDLVEFKEFSEVYDEDNADAYSSLRSLSDFSKDLWVSSNSKNAGMLYFARDIARLVDRLFAQYESLTANIQPCVDKAEDVCNRMCKLETRSF